MKKVLSLIVAILIIASITVSASAAVTMYPYVFKAVHTDGVEYTFHFGTRDNTSEEVGIEINGKKYQATSFDAETNTKFGIGIADPQNILGDEYAYKTFSGSSYGEETTIAKADIPAWDEIAPEEEEVDNTVYEQVSIVASGVYSVQRQPNFLTLDKWLSDNVLGTNNIKTRLYTAGAESEIPGQKTTRQLALLQLKTTAKGITNTETQEDRIILTIYLKADSYTVDGGSVRLAGIANENYIPENGSEDNLPVEDDKYIFETRTPKPLSTSTTAQPYEYDITEYVRERVKGNVNGDEVQISLFLVPDDSNWNSGENSYIYFNTKESSGYPVTISYETVNK